MRTSTTWNSIGARTSATLLLCWSLLLTGGCSESVAGDSDLVGAWRQTHNTSVMVTDIYMSLGSDGRFRYSTRCESSFRGTTTPTVDGRWKADGGHLYTMPDGQSQWTDMGPYRISGNSMLLAGRYWSR